MPPKPKDVKKGGAPSGNYKAGKPLKDILPPSSKPPREGVPLNAELQPDIHRQNLYEPYANIAEWPGNEEAKNNDFAKDAHKDEHGHYTKYTDASQIYLPPSFHEFEKGSGEIQWLRPEEYLREIAFDNELQKRRMERKLLMNKMKKLKKQSMLAMGATNQSTYDDLNNLSRTEKALGDEPPINREELHYEMLCIAYEERLETEEEVKKRKEEAEKIAAADKNAKKKPPPAKGAPVVADPLDEP